MTNVQVHCILLAAIVNCYLAYIYSTIIVDPEIRLGFFYPLFPQYAVDEADFVPSVTGMQMLAAIQLAIKQINDKTDGIADDILPSTQIKFAARINPPSFTATAVDVIGLESVAFNTKGIQVAIGGVTNNLTQAMSSFLQDSDICQIGYNDGSLISHNDLYSNYLRTSPSNAYSAHFLVDLLVTQYKYNRVIVFSATEDIDCGDALIEFQEKAAVEGLHIVDTILFPFDSTDLSSYISQAKDYEPRIIVLLMQPQNTALFLEQAYEVGILKQGVSVFATKYGTDGIFTHFKNTTDVPTVMSGLQVILKNLNWTETAAGQAFIEQFRNLPDTVSYSNGTAVCNNGTDDDGSFYIYQQHLNYNESERFVCAGLDHENFTAANIYLMTGFAYDAVFAMARGLDYMMYQESYPGFSGAILKKTIIEQVRFPGVTGEVSFSGGRTSFTTYGIGDRLEGLRYSLMNFNPDVFAMDNHGPTFADLAGFARVGDIVNGLVLWCDAATTSDCAAILYNTADNSVPLDAPLPANNDLEQSLKDVILALACIFIVLSAAAIAFCVYFSHNSAVKSAQPMLLVWTLLGCILGGCRVIVTTYTLDKDVCEARIWLCHLTFYVILASIMAKMYRLHLIINAVGMQKVVVSEYFALYIFLGGLAGFIIYLIIFASVGNPLPVQKYTVSKTGQRTYNTTCVASSPEIEYILLGVEGIMLFLAIGLCWATSNAPKKVNETGTNIRITAGVALFFVAYVIQTFDPEIDPVTMRAVVAFVFLICIAITLTLTTIPKIQSVREGKGKRTGSRMKGGSGSLSMTAKPEEVLGAILTKYNTLEKDQKLEMCIKHIEVWRNMLVDVEISEERRPGNASAYLA